MNSGFGNMSRRVSVLLVLCMLMASLSPLALAEPGQEDIGPTVMSGDLSDFTPSIEGKRYMFTNDSEPVFSATGPVSYTHLTLPTIYSV